MTTTVYRQVSNRGGREVHRPFGRIRRAANTESGGIIRTERFQRTACNGDSPLPARDFAWPMPGNPSSCYNIYVIVIKKKIR
jgi:hypothetical protein